MKTKLYTIGHSNHTAHEFVRLLEDNGVMTVVDVRSSPHSRFSPHFDAESLERLLPRHNIQYAFAGRWMGGRPEDPTCYRSGSLPDGGADYLHEVDYQAIMTRSWFLAAIARLLEMAHDQTTAIMCSEEDPARCHRHHLIARFLLDEHPEIDVQHIRGDGAVYSAAAVRVSLEVDDIEQLSLW
jgi:uncharacterized protein (DUF488 family)